MFIPSRIATAHDELRAATKKAAEAAAEILNSGDLTRADFVSVFALTKGERASLLPASPRRGVAALGDGLGSGSDAADAPTDDLSHDPGNGS